LYHHYFFCYGADGAAADPAGAVPAPAAGAVPAGAAGGGSPAYSLGKQSGNICIFKEAGPFAPKGFVVLN